MEITQRNLWNRTNFQFEEQNLKYSLKSGSRSFSFSVRYLEISTNPCEVQTKSTLTRNIGILLILAGVAHEIFYFLEHGTLTFSAWFALGLLVIAVHYLTKTAYTILPAGNYHIAIIKDSKHDRIYNEIISRRKALLYSRYGKIDYDNDPEDEINKFIWLRKEGVISDEELELIVKKISDYHEKKLKTGSITGSDRKDILH